jgi:hypothetical protein
MFDKKNVDLSGEHEYVILDWNFSVDSYEGPMDKESFCT